MRVTDAVGRGLRSALKATAAAVDVVRPSPSGLVILVYHRIGSGTPSQVDLPVELFEAQIEELSSSGRLTSLDDGLGLMGSADEHPNQPVVLTFDDGTSDWVDVVLPVLDRHRAPATFYVATDHVERGRPFAGGAPAVSWSGLRDLASTELATIASHTHTHALLDRVDGPTARSELERSIDLIGERLGLECQHFAYPKALLGSPAAEAEVRRLFRSAAVAGSRPNPFDATDVHRLWRTPLQTGDGMRWFRRKAAGGLRLEDSLRSLANRRRYAGATT